MDDDSVYVRTAIRRPQVVDNGILSVNPHSHAHGPDSHEHHDACGHQQVLHGDHIDYLFDGKLHHYEEGQCAVHGELDVDELQILLRSAGVSPVLHIDDDDNSGSILVRRRNARFVKAARQMAALSPGTGSSSGLHPSSLKPAHVLPWYRERDALRFVAMMCLTGSFLCVELGVGLAINSLALQADAFHMLSDLGALAIGWYAHTASKRAHSSTASFGYARFEVVGSLINAVFLLATAIQIVLEAIPRLVETVQEGAGHGAGAGPSDAPLLLIVGAVGLGINLLGILVFSSGHGHGHSHGGHGHSHGKAEPVPAPTPEALPYDDPLPGPTPTAAPSASRSDGSDSGAECGGLGIPHGHSHSHGHEHGHGLEHGHSHVEVQEASRASTGHGHSHGPGAPPAKAAPPAMSMNMQGVLLHVMGDALGSVAVLISGAIMYYTQWTRRELADPLASLFIVAILVIGTVPLLRQSAEILLEKVPSHIDLSSLRAQLLAVPGVLSLHDLHVWAVNPGRTVGTMHVILDRRVGLGLAGGGATFTSFRRVADAVKAILHSAGVHASTVQPEWVSHEMQARVEKAAQEAMLKSRVNAHRGSVTGAQVDVPIPAHEGVAHSVAQTHGTDAGQGLNDSGLLALDMCDEIVCGLGDACVASSCCPDPHPYGAAVRRR